MYMLVKVLFQRVETKIQGRKARTGSFWKFVISGQRTHLFQNVSRLVMLILHPLDRMLDRPERRKHWNSVSRFSSYEILNIREKDHLLFPHMRCQVVDKLKELFPKFIQLRMIFTMLPGDLFHQTTEPLHFASGELMMCFDDV